MASGLPRGCKSHGVLHTCRSAPVKVRGHPFTAAGSSAVGNRRPPTAWGTGLLGFELVDRTGDSRNVGRTSGTVEIRAETGTDRPDDHGGPVMYCLGRLPKHPTTVACRETNARVKWTSGLPIVHPNAGGRLDGRGTRGLSTEPDRSSRRRMRRALESPAGPKARRTEHDPSIPSCPFLPLRDTVPAGGFLKGHEDPAPTGGAHRKYPNGRPRTEGVRSWGKRRT